MSSNSSERFDLLDRIADEFAARWRKGEQPSVDEYVERYPDLVLNQAFSPLLVA
jgi:hypothetical protein